MKIITAFIASARRSGLPMRSSQAHIITASQSRHRYFRISSCSLRHSVRSWRQDIWAVCSVGSVVE
jgi:hypothetical protein